MIGWITETLNGWMAHLWLGDTGNMPLLINFIAITFDNVIIMPSLNSYCCHTYVLPEPDQCTGLCTT